jgi:hypothetical protein
LGAGTSETKAEAFGPGAVGSSSQITARAGNHHLWQLSALRAHTKTPYKIDLLWKILRALKRFLGPRQLML